MNATPSMAMASPATNPASSLTRKSTARATSSGSPRAGPWLPAREAGRYRRQRRHHRDAHRRPKAQYPTELPGFAIMNTRQAFLLPRTSSSLRRPRSRQAKAADTTSTATSAPSNSFFGFSFTAPVYRMCECPLACSARRNVSCVCHLLLVGRRAGRGRAVRRIKGQVDDRHGPGVLGTVGGGNPVQYFLVGHLRRPLRRPCGPRPTVEITLSWATFLAMRKLPSSVASRSWPSTLAKSSAASASSLGSWRPSKRARQA